MNKCHVSYPCNTNVVNLLLHANNRRATLCNTLFI